MTSIVQPAGGIRCDGIAIIGSMKLDALRQKHGSCACN